MKSKSDFRHAVIVLISIFLMMVAGQSGSTIGVIICSLPSIYVPFGIYFSEKRNIKTNNSTIKYLLIARVVLNLVAVFSAVSIIVSLLIELIFTTDIVLVWLFIVCLCNLIIELSLRHLIKKELISQYEDSYYKKL